jgi:hypothetical protein
MYRREPSREPVSVGGAFSREVVMELMAEGGCRYLDAFGLWATNAYPVEPLNGDVPVSSSDGLPDRFHRMAFIAVELCCPGQAGVSPGGPLRPSFFRQYSRVFQLLGHLLAADLKQGFLTLAPGAVVQIMECALVVAAPFGSRL